MPKALAAPITTGGTIELRLFDGTRQPAAIEGIVRIFDGRQRLVHQDDHTGPVIQFTGLNVTDTLDDRYAVSIAADKYILTGFAPVVIGNGPPARVDLMLIPKRSKCDFTSASWTALSASHPSLVAFLANGAPSNTQARARYEKLMADDPRSLAALLNIWTAMSDIHLQHDAPTDYLKQLVWTGDHAPKVDRFFCYVDARLVTEVVRAAGDGVFEAEPNPAVFHHGATQSYKQVQFGEANVQLTFHEHDTATIDGVPCVLLEPDIDYYKDLLAHGLLEVADSRKTDPESVYVLRWTAGRHAGVPEFDPPYTIVPR